MTKIGIYPGTFDPLHAGHLAFAEEAIQACNLNQVVLLPETTPRNKPLVSQLSIRNQNIEHVIKDKPHLETFLPTTDRFTIQHTLPEIKRVFQHEELAFLVGSDVIKTMAAWPHLEALLRHSSIIVGMRHTESRHETELSIQKIEKRCQITVSYTILHTPYASLSSTKLRAEGTVPTVQL